MKNAFTRSLVVPFCCSIFRVRKLLCLAGALAVATTGWTQRTEPEAPPLPSDNAPLFGPRDFAGKTVKEIDIRFRTGTTVDRARLLSRMRLKVGEPWTQEKEEDDLRAFITSGDLMNPSIDTVAVPGGVKVIVTANARPAMGELIFQGNTAVSTAALTDLVEFKAGNVVDEAKLSEAKVKILERYEKKGYPDVVVTYSVEPSDAGFARIIFRIEEGTRGVIDSVAFQGNTVFSSRRLRGEITSDNRNYMKFWDLKRKLNHEKVEKDITAIQDLYGNHGYFDARVTSVEPVPTGSGDKVTLIFHIVEGPQYTTAQVGITGNKVFDTATLLPVFQLEAGKTFSLAGMKMDIETIQEFYGSHGYAEVRVTPRIDKRAGNQLYVTYVIEEGGQFKVGKINIIGNADTRDTVIRRELAIEPGEDYNTIKIRKSLQKIRNLDYFDENNGVDFMPVSSDLGPEYKDINITVNEKKTGSLQFGVGFSSIDNLVGMVEVTQRNFDLTNWPSFTGGGQRFRLSLKWGSERKDFLLSITEPYFMGERLSLTGDLFWTEKTYLSDVYSQRDAGGSLTVRRPLGDNSDIRLGYTLQQVEIYDIDPDASDAIKSEEGDFLQSRLSTSYVFDNRDSIQLPTRGHKITLEAFFSGGFLGGEVDDYTVSLAGQKFWLLPWKSIFSLEGKVAVVDGFDGSDVHIFDRQFLGGANNLRGWDYREVGPLDVFGEPLGGNTMAYITAEYTIPVYRTARAAFFADAGFVNEDSWDFNTSDFSADVGLGLRIRVPMLGPLKLDYGIPVRDGQSKDSSGQFHFSMDYKW